MCLGRRRSYRGKGGLGGLSTSLGASCIGIMLRNMDENRSVKVEFIDVVSVY